MTAEMILDELMGKMQDWQIETTEDRDTCIGILQFYIQKLDDLPLPDPYTGPDEDLQYEIMRDLLMEAEA